MRRLGQLVAALVLAAAPAALPAGAREARDAAVVTSPGPRTVAVTVYRNPSRGRYEAMDLRWLQGFALVTETRTVRLPKGRATLRFEGVAEGIVPVSAIVDGLPGGTVEKNRDARLLSPAALVDGTLGRQVTLTRTNRATGQRTSEPATIVAGPSPGVVLKTAAGIETLRCSGLPEGLSFAGVPAGLSAKPVLSVTTDTPSARTATVTLSYLAGGFDWSASYVATVRPGGDGGAGGDAGTLDLFAWLTLANANPEAFTAARVKAVAGRLNRRATGGWMRAAGALSLRCYPLGTTTSDLKLRRFEMARGFAPPAEEGQDIVVTGMRLMAPPPPPPPAPPPPPPPPPPPGDLKLYTVPRDVTVAPRAQKQVALLAAGGVPFERRYRRAVYPGQTLTAAATGVVLVLRNVKERGLGLPLPAGTTALYAARGASGREGSGGEQLLIGTGTLGDHAVGQRVRIGAGISRQVLVAQRTTGDKRAELTVTNANPFAVAVELPIGRAGQAITADGDALTEVDGVRTWQVQVAPGDSATLAYRYE